MIFFHTLDNKSLEELYKNKSIYCKLSDTYDDIDRNPVLLVDITDDRFFKIKSNMEVEIKSEEILLIIYPVIKDIIYSCNIDIKRSYEFFIKNKDILNKIIENMIRVDTLFKKMYSSIYEGTDLIDRLIDSYNYMPCDIKVRYEMLKDVKKEKLKVLIEKINNKLNTRLSVKRLIDDNILVKGLDSLNSLTLVSKSGKTYEYDLKSNSYKDISKQIICKDKVKELSLKR